MTAPAIMLPPRPRTLKHPGAFNPVRIQSRHADRGAHFRLMLQPGLSLYDALVGPLAEAGVKSASITILGGCFRAFNYCVAPPDPTGSAVVAYTAPIFAGETYLVFGNATIGRNQSGKPIVHCHAAFRTETGLVRGGHILAETSIVGTNSVPVLVTKLHGIDLRVAYDAETNIPLIQPQEEAPNE